MPDTPIGTNSPDYTLVTADLGADIYCKVTATNASGTANADSNTVGPVAAAPSGAFAYLIDTEAQGDDTFSTSAINTTGAELLIVVMNDFSGAATISDSKGNVWTAVHSPTASSCLWYCYPTSVGSSHTVTFTGTGMYGAACFTAFSGGSAGENQAFELGGLPSDLPSPIVPVQNNSLAVSAAYIVDAGGGSSTIDESFIKICDLPRTGQLGLAVAYLIQTTAVEVSPTWTLPGTAAGGFINTVFSPAPLVMSKPGEKEPGNA